MKKIYYITLFCLSLIISLLVGCVDKYEITQTNNESLLVVEATLINQLGPQIIKLSRTIPLNSDEPVYVNDAQVWVEDGNQNIYVFTITEMGNYVSDSNFQTIEGETYVLHITTTDGFNYVSSAEVAPPTSEIENLSTQFQTLNGEEGIQVLVSSSPGEGLYFKYDYEETYKVVAPFYNALDFKIENVTGDISNIEYDIVLQPKEENLRTCYSTKYSTSINQASLNELDVNAVIDFPVRFIDKNNEIIRERYSILVTQYVQNFEAYNFYKKLKELGITENLLVENQPGFIQGNIISLENPDESVVGFFQVSSVSSSRIFFDYSEFGLLRPPYFTECNFQYDLDYNDNTTLDQDKNERYFMYTIFTQEEPSYLYVEGADSIYSFVTASCGDCSRISSTIIPEFWED